jgi:nucleotide-binding universal stress UspA family protein
MQRIVVGVDGSPMSREALRWAIAEGRLRGAELQAVHAWQERYLTPYPIGVAQLEFGAAERAARELLDAVVDAEDATGLPGPIEKIVVCDGGASALIQTAKGADLLVVGSRGRGGFSGLLLGSVSQQIAHHAPCPLVIVPNTA